MTTLEVEVTHRGHVPAPHGHDGFEETLQGLTGTLTLTVDGKEILLGPRRGVRRRVRRN